jgi:hypothetical protein
MLIVGNISIISILRKPLSTPSLSGVALTASLGPPVSTPVHGSSEANPRTRFQVPVSSFITPFCTCQLQRVTVFL